MALEAFIMNIILIFMFILTTTFIARVQAEEWEDESEYIESEQTNLEEFEDDDEYGDEYGDEDEDKKLKSPNVEIFVTSWCGYSRKAIEFLNSQNIEFSIYDIEEDPDAADRKDELAPDSGIPVAVINGKTIIGFTEKNTEKHYNRVHRKVLISS